MKTFERINETTTVRCRGEKFVLTDETTREKTTLTLEDISKIAAVQDHVHGMTGDEARRLVKFAARMMAHQRYASWGLQ